MDTRFRGIMRYRRGDEQTSLTTILQDLRFRGEGSFVRSSCMIPIFRSFSLRQRTVFKASIIEIRRLPSQTHQTFIPSPSFRCLASPPLRTPVPA